MHLLANEVRNCGCEVELAYTGSLRRLGSFLSAGRRLRSKVRGCDLVHAQYGSACGHVASRLSGTKLLTLRGSDWYGVPPTRIKNRLHNAACRWLTRTQLRKYKCVVVMSKRMKCEILTERSGLHVRVLPDGIDLDQFRPLDRFEARRRLGMAGDQSPWVLFATVSDDNPVKRVPLAQAAFALFAKQVPGAKLKILTGVPHDKVSLWVNACDVTLLTSSHEGWPNIIKESLACNVPFVSTDVSDLRAIADAEPGCTVADATPEALCEALLQTLDRDPPGDLRRHVARMGVGETARRLVALYAELAGLVDYEVHRCRSHT